MAVNEDDARYQRSRAAILEAGIAVLLRNPQAGMSEIAQKAGVGRATLYRHFESRDALVRALSLWCLEETDACLAPIQAADLSGLAAIEASIDVLVPLADRYRFLMSLMHVTEGDSEVEAVYRRQLKELAELVRAGQQSGDINPELPVAWVVATYDAMLNAAWALLQDQALTSEQAKRAFRTSFAASVRPPDQ